MRKGFIPLLLALCLSACGFHLRGMIDVPNWLTDIAITSNGVEDVELVSSLKSQLKSQKIRIQPDLINASYRLIINRIEFQQRIISVGASTNPRQYQLILAIDFMVQSRKGEIVSPLRQVVVTRQLTVNNDRILGSNEEERILMNEMRQDAIMQICSILFRATPIRHAN